MSWLVFALFLGVTFPKVGSVDETTPHICYGSLGCFEIGKEWTRNGRVPSPEKPRNDTAIVYYYSRNNTQRPILFSTYPEVNLHGVEFHARHPTEVIIHGYLQDSTVEWVQTIKYFSLLDRNANVLVLDYSHACRKGFVQSVSNTRVVGRLTSRLLKFLSVHWRLPMERVHLIGLGLGAHIASYIGKEVPGISRLTALDPQQPYFEGYDRKIRLDKTDATFVEVVHTNAMTFETWNGLGMMEPHGHVDFYFNDGGNQPDCVQPPGFPSITSVKDLFRLRDQYRVYTNMCSQNRAGDFLIDAYNSFDDCMYWGRKVSSPPVADTESHTLWKYIQSLFSEFSYKPISLGPCRVDNCIPFAYNTSRYSLRGIFVVKTYRNYPYCIPDSGPKHQRDKNNVKPKSKA